MDNTITLNSELGQVRFEFLGLVEYDSEEYVIMLPADDPDEMGSVVILRMERTDKDSEEAAYISVEDEDTLLAVFDIFKEKFEDEFDFADIDDWD